MPPEVLSRVGEPFFSTKAPGAGLGLGVFIARSLCEQMGGRLTLESSPGEARRLASRSRARVPGRSGMTGEPRPARRLLIVEDDDVLRAPSRAGLSRAGVRGAGGRRRRRRDAPGPRRAARATRSWTCGCRTPRASRSCARSIAADPAMAVVVLTGYGSIATALEAVRLGARHYLTKPADVDEILAAFDREPPGSPRGPSPVPTLARVEWEHINRVLADCGGNISEAARVLGIHRRSLQRKLAKFPAPALNRAQNAFEMPKRIEKRGASWASFTCRYDRHEDMAVEAHPLRRAVPQARVQVDDRGPRRRDRSAAELAPALVEELHLQRRRQPAHRAADRDRGDRLVGEAVVVRVRRVDLVGSRQRDLRPARADAAPLERGDQVARPRPGLHRRVEDRRVVLVEPVVRAEGQLDADARHEHVPRAPEERLPRPDHRGRPRRGCCRSSGRHRGRSRSTCG